MTNIRKKSRKYLEEKLSHSIPNLPPFGDPVNTEEVLPVIDKFREANIPDMYCWVFDLRDHTYYHQVGVEKCLGYKEPLDLIDTIAIIHPQQVETFFEYRKKLYEIVSSPNQIAEPLLNLVRFWVGIRHANGNYFYVKQVLTPFEIDANQRLVSHLSYFTIIRDFRNDELTFDLDETITDRHVIHDFLNVKKEASHPFSKREFELILKMRDNPDLSSEELSKVFSISKHTIDNHKKNIKSKANHFFPAHFNNAKDVTLYLVRMGII